MTETAVPGRAAEAPLQVREVSRKMADYIGKLGRVWVEGQVAELTIRPGHGFSYLVLRDSAAEVSLSVVVPRAVLESLSAPLTDGAQVVVNVGVEWWERRGEVRFKAVELRPVGLGELLAVLEARRRLLAAEGLFDDARKRPLPLVPRRVGLICGRGSAAEKDVIENARRRWPEVEFEVRPVPVQGPEAAGAVRTALAELDALAEVDVIVITRGGGSFEDLLPFSDESLIRAVSAAFTPVVSAIGHEEDSPLLDLVADVRASTPTDAARRVVPDARDERRRVGEARDRLRGRVVQRLSEAARDVAAMRTHPALRAPEVMLTERSRLVGELRGRARDTVAGRLRHEAALSQGRRTHLEALSPQATLARGFAVVRTITPSRVITSAEQAVVGAVVDVRVAAGSFRAEVTSSQAASPTEGPS